MRPYILIISAVIAVLICLNIVANCNGNRTVSDKGLRDTITLYDTLIKNRIDTVTLRITERNNYVRTIEKIAPTKDTAKYLLNCLTENAKLWKVVINDSVIFEEQGSIIKMQVQQINRLKLLDTINVTKLNACMSENKKIQQARNKRRKWAKVAHIASALGLTYLLITK